MTPGVDSVFAWREPGARTSMSSSSVISAPLAATRNGGAVSCQPASASTTVLRVSRSTTANQPSPPPSPSEVW